MTTLKEKRTKKRAQFNEVPIYLTLDIQTGNSILMDTVSAARIVNVMSYHGLRPFFRHSRISDDVDDGSGHFGYASRRPRREQFPKVPNEAGRELMGSGDFGSNSHYVDELKKRKKALATRLMWRELGIDVNGPRTRATQSISQVSAPRLEYKNNAKRIIGFDSSFCGR